jgi:hypothetical protein
VSRSSDTPLETFVPLAFRRRGQQRVVGGAGPVHDTTLLAGLGRAFYWQRLLDSGRMGSGADVARAEGLHPSVPNELLRLTLLAPDLIEMLMSGRQPRRMTLMWFQRHPLPVDWEAQRRIVARFEGEA